MMLEENRSLCQIPLEVPKAEEYIELEELAKKLRKRNERKMAIIQKASQSPNKATEKTSETSDVEMTDTSADAPSKLGKFGWHEIEGTVLPYLSRINPDIKLVSRRMANVKIFSGLKKFFDKELLNCLNMHPIPATAAEANLLNDINQNHSDKCYGAECFEERDSLFLLSDITEMVEFLRYCCCVFDNGLAVERMPCGFMKIGPETVPYAIDGVKMYMPLFYFDGDVKPLQEKAVEISGWKLSYVKLLCKIQGVRSEFFEGPSIKCVELEYLKTFFPPNTLFEETWPAENKLVFRAPASPPYAPNAIQNTSMTRQLSQGQNPNVPAVPHLHIPQNFRVPPPNISPNFPGPPSYQMPNFPGPSPNHTPNLTTPVNVPRMSPSAVSAQRMSGSTANVKRISPPTANVQRISPPVANMQRISSPVVNSRMSRPPPPYLQPSVTVAQSARLRDIRRSSSNGIPPRNASYLTNGTNHDQYQHNRQVLPDSTTSLGYRPQNNRVNGTSAMVYGQPATVRAPTFQVPSATNYIGQPAVMMPCTYDIPSRIQSQLESEPPPLINNPKLSKRGKPQLVFHPPPTTNNHSLQGTIFTNDACLIECITNPQVEVDGVTVSVDQVAKVYYHKPAPVLLKTLMDLKVKIYEPSQHQSQLMRYSRFEKAYGMVSVTDLREHLKVIKILLP